MACVEAVSSSVILLDVYIPQGETRHFDDHLLDCEDARLVIEAGHVKVTYDSNVEVEKKPTTETLPKTPVGGENVGKGRSGKTKEESSKSTTSDKQEE